MSLIEHRRMVESIDRRMQQLNNEIEILVHMADYMPDFHHVMTNASRQEMDAFYMEYDGFFRFAKILETLAISISENKAKALRKENEIAKAIDVRIHQLKAQGIDGAKLLAQMVGHLPDFHWLWNTVSDETLAFLFREYTGFYHYAMLMEEANESKNKSSYAHLPELPDSIKKIVSNLFKEGAAIEQGCQSIIDEQHKRDMWLEIEIIETKLEWWMRSFSELPKHLEQANVPAESCSIMLGILTPMCERINQLWNQVIRRP